MAPRPSGPHLAQRLRTLALTTPPATALFYARIYSALYPPTEAEHDSLHVLALCLLQTDQPYPALEAVRDSANGDGDPDDMDYESTDKPGCYGCAVIVAKCCNRLSRFTEGQAVLERAVRRSTPMSESRAGLPKLTVALPVVTPAETAATANLMLASLSHNGKSPVQAVEFYTKALAEDLWLWEAFTGLCDIGELPCQHMKLTTRSPAVTRDSLPRSTIGTLIGQTITKRYLVAWTNAAVVRFRGAEFHQPAADEPISHSSPDHIFILHS